jgi:Tfp pilus assembly PilM family ATPase
VAAPISLLNKLTALVEDSNLIADSIQTELSASLSLIDMMDKKDNLCKLYINFGLSTTTIYLFCPNPATGLSIPVQIRNFPLGLDLFLKDIKANLNITEKEVLNILETNGFLPNGTVDISKIVESPYNEFIAQIQKFLQSVKSTNEISIKKICLFGEGHKIKGLEAKLSASVGIPTEVLNPYPLFIKNNVSDFFKNDLPYFIPSIGSSI